jgi:hypothetical protein
MAEGLRVWVKNVHTSWVHKLILKATCREGLSDEVNRLACDFSFMNEWDKCLILNPSDGTYELLQLR